MIIIFPSFQAGSAWLSAATLLTAGPATAPAAPLTFNTALPVAKGELVTRVQYVTKRWILEGGVQLPVAQDLNGDALEADYVARFGFRVNF